jgi:DNA-binding protein HU-beta
MASPLVGLAVGAVARAAAKNPAQEAAKKAATKAAKKAATKAAKKVRTKVKAKTADQARANATKKPLTASERAFLKNQREKAKAVKRTGIYPNTAN